MESNTPQDSAALALQIQTLTANMEELTRQIQEMRLWLQQEDNRSRTNQDDNKDSKRRDDCWQIATPERAGSDLLQEMRREMDELRSAIKEKTNQSLNWMVRRTDSSFITVVLECRMP